MTSIISNSTNSFYSTSPNTTIDDDEESFYDAIDPDPDQEGLKCLKINIVQQTTDDEHYFDTVTSRHTSESTCLSPLATAQKYTNKISDLNENVNIINVTEAEEQDNLDEEKDLIDAELETSWSFWIDKCEQGETQTKYEAGLKLIHTVNTVQTFWSVYNNIPDVSMLPNRYTYHLMRNKRRPLWEDKENFTGGLWKFKCKKKDSPLVWREVLLAVIGEQLSDHVSPKDDIIGVSVGRREKDDLIQIWNLDFNYEKEASIENKIKDLVPNVQFSAIFYKAHSKLEEYQKTNSSTANNNNMNKNKYNSNSTYVNNNKTPTITTTTTTTNNNNNHTNQHYNLNNSNNNLKYSINSNNNNKQKFKYDS